MGGIFPPKTWAKPHILPLRRQGRSLSSPLSHPLPPPLRGHVPEKQDFWFSDFLISNFALFIFYFSADLKTRLKINLWKLIFEILIFGFNILDQSLNISFPSVPVSCYPLSLFQIAGIKCPPFKPVSEMRDMNSKIFSKLFLIPGFGIFANRIGRPQSFLILYMFFFYF